MLIVLLSFNFIAIKLLVVIIVVETPIIFYLKVRVIEALLCLNIQIIMRLMQIYLIFDIVLHDFNRVLEMRTVIRHRNLS